MEVTRNEKLQNLDLAILIGGISPINFHIQTSCAQAD